MKRYYFQNDDNAEHAHVNYHYLVKQQHRNKTVLIFPQETERNGRLRLSKDPWTGGINAKQLSISTSSPTPILFRGRSHSQTGHLSHDNHFPTLEIV